MNACSNEEGLMVKKVSMRRGWTSGDIRELKSLARKKTPALRIARHLKRTEGATRQKALISLLPTTGMQLDFTVSLGGSAS
jgi:hypothetical protein